MPQTLAMAFFDDLFEYPVHRRIIGMNLPGLQIGPRQLQLLERIGRDPVQHLRIAAVQIIDFGRGQAVIDLLDKALARRKRLKPRLHLLGARLLAKTLLRERGLSERAIALVEQTTPPPYRNNFRDDGATTPEDTRVYLEYIQSIIDSGEIEAVIFKLSDIRDTMDVLEALTDDAALHDQLITRYRPSYALLVAAAEGH